MIRVNVYLEDPAALLAVGAFGAGALIRIERAADSDGPFTEVGTVAITTAAQPFTYWDAGGDADSWYRWRVSDSGDTVQSPYSAAFQGWNPASTVSSDAYASLADVLALFESSAAIKSTRYARLNELLRTASSELNTLLGGRDYFRHPATGTETWYGELGDVRNDIVHAHAGIVSIDALEVSDDAGATFAPVTAGDFYLRSSNPDSDAPIPAGEPGFHVVMTGLGARASFPRGKRVVRFTGARGWPAVPRVLREGVAERARQLAFADPSFEGSVPSMDDFGHPTVSHRWPDALYTFIEAERHRFWCHT